MSTIFKTNSDAAKSDKIHFIPCDIDHDGEADVSKYFSGVINKSDESGVMRASFRGRPLVGKVANLPEGYQGVIVNEKGKTYSDQQERVVQVEKSFDKFTYWNLETQPSDNDAIMRAFDWLGVAHVLHTPVSKEKREEENVKLTTAER